MATTTNFGWETPDDTDLVKDGALAMRTLGNSIDTSFVDLKGGTTGQILSKASNTDLDYTWINNDQGDITGVTAGTGLSGGGTSGDVTLSLSIPVTEVRGGTNQTTYTTGDLLYASGANTLAKRAIGTSGQVLTVTSGVPTWATPASTSPTFVGAAAYKSATTQSINNATDTIVTYDAEEFDTDGFHSGSVNTGRMTIPSGKAGKYLLIANTIFAANATGARSTNFMKNGTSAGAFQQLVSAGSSTSTIFSMSAIVDLAVGDYVEVNAYQNSGGALNINNNQSGTRFAIQYLGA